MTVAEKLAYETTSTIAIDRSINQRVSGVVIPFPDAESRQEITANSIAVGEAIQAAMVEAVEAIKPEPEQAIATEPATALIDRASLSRAFEIVSEVIERAHIPILGNARLKAGSGTISISGTDLDIEITATTHAAADRHFDVTLPAKKMKELLKGAPKADYVAFEDKGDRVSADFEKVAYALQSLPSSDYPQLTGPKPEGAYFMMRGKDFVDGLDAVAGAISTEETRYYLNGIFLQRYDTSNGHELRMVATDGHRLYMQKLELPEVIGAWPMNSGYMAGVILPRKLVGLLSKLMRGKKCPDFVNITLDDAKSKFQFSYEFGEVIVTAKHIDGTFPDYQRVVPSYSNFAAARFDVDQLAEGIKACALIAEQKAKAIKLTVNESGASLDVNCPENGSAHADIECDWQSEEIQIGFNSRYMLDILDVAGDGEAAVYLQDAGSPAVVTGARAGWLAVLMPMRV